MYNEKPINLEALFTGGNPFEEAGSVNNNDTEPLPDNEPAF
jgi:hypothetical protein